MTGDGESTITYYKWFKDFMEAGKSRLKGEETRDATRCEVNDLKRENERLKQLVAELYWTPKSRRAVGATTSPT